MEYLVYSNKEVYNQTNNGKMFVDGATVSVSYYDGKKFSSRLNEGELSDYRKTYDDTEIIFKGEVDETLIEVKEEGHYETFYDARYWMEFDQRQEEEISEEIDSMNPSE